MTSAAVTVRTDRNVRALYDQLWDVPPPATTPGRAAGATRVRTHAAAHGWPPPLGWDDIDTDCRPPGRCGRTGLSTAAWLVGRTDPAPVATLPHQQNAAVDQPVDEIAIERAVSTGVVSLDQLTRAEQVVVIRRLTDRGQSLHQIATRLHTSARTVSRRRNDGMV